MGLSLAKTARASRVREHGVASVLEAGEVGMPSRRSAHTTVASSGWLGNMLVVNVKAFRTWLEKEFVPLRAARLSRQTRTVPKARARTLTGSQTHRLQEPSANQPARPVQRRGHGFRRAARQVASKQLLVAALAPRNAFSKGCPGSPLPPRANEFCADERDRKQLFFRGRGSRQRARSCPVDLTNRRFQPERNSTAATLCRRLTSALDERTLPTCPMRR